MSHGPRKPAVIFIFVTLLLDVLGFGLLIPVAPKLYQQLMEGHGGTEQQAANAMGILTALYAVMQFCFSPMLGVLSDRFGRRPVLLVALFGSGLDYFVMAFAQTLPILYITRAINGISGASMTVANAYIADVTPPEKRAGAFGMVGAAFGLGFVLGPLMGGFLGDYNIRYPYYAAGALTLCNWLYGFFVLPESLPREKRGHFTFARANPIGAFRGLGRYPLVAGLVGSFFLSNVAQFGLHTTWVLYTGHKFGWGPRGVGLSLFAVGVCAAVVQAGLARKVIPLLGEKRALMMAMGIMVLTFFGYGAVTQGWMIYPVIIFGSLAGLGMPAAQSMITRTVRPYEQGAIQGAITGINCIAQIVGPLIGSAVYAYFISDGRNLPGAPFYVGSALSVLAWIAAGWAISTHGKHWENTPKPEGLSAHGSPPEAAGLTTVEDASPS